MEERLSDLIDQTLSLADEIKSQQGRRARLAAARAYLWLAADNIAKARSRWRAATGTTDLDGPADAWAVQQQKGE